MSDVRWYMTLALWKSAVFLEGSYKRRLAGTTEDAFFDRLETACPRWPSARGASPGDDADGLIIDFGGVLTTDVFDSFAAFCRARGSTPDTVRDRFREDADARDLLGELETGRSASGLRGALRGRCSASSPPTV